VGKLMAGRAGIWLYEKNRNNSARYILGEKGKNPLVCIGINPSTAEPNNLDRTLTSVKRISILNGYEGWLMLNVYPQRSTNPNRLHEEMDEKLHSFNLNYISEYLSKFKDVDVWAAWGTLIHKRQYLIFALRNIVERLEGIGVRWVRIGNISKNGHPHHPLYLSHQSRIETFDIQGYLRGL
jgi:hypothetical protein